MVNKFDEPLTELRKKDNSIYYIGQSISKSSLPQHIAIKNKQKILDANYGLLLKNSPAYYYDFYDFGIFNKYHDIVPKYFISGKNVKLSKFNKHYLLSFYSYKNSF